MKVTIKGKRYDSDMCEELGEYNHYNNGNESGTTYLLRAEDGTLLSYTDSNGQDCFLSDSMEVFDGNIDFYEMSEDQEKRCAELKLIEIV